MEKSLQNFLFSISGLPPPARFLMVIPLKAITTFITQHSVLSDSSSLSAYAAHGSPPWKNKTFDKSHFYLFGSDHWHLCYVWTWRMKLISQNPLVPQMFHPSYLPIQGFCFKAVIGNDELRPPHISVASLHLPRAPSNTQFDTKSAPTLWGAYTSFRLSPVKQGSATLGRV